jgi:GrpB-like predicted nucleotidyltransferase (UPF0157 family)
VSVSVYPYSAAWPESFRQEARLLTARLAPWLSHGIEHIGSTAVPNLSAKPILDMLAGITDLDAAREAIPVLAELGYRHADHRPHEALWFYKQPGEKYEDRTHQLHLTQPDSTLWRERLAFRDALREAPDCGTSMSPSSRCCRPRPT